MYTSGFQWDLSTDNAAEFASRTKLVTKEELQISEMSGARFLIVLPEGLHPKTFINATPQELWDEGITFQPWTPLEDASISIPAYKVLLRLVGLPPHLFREKYVKQAVARFGVFLGSMEPENPSSVASWLVAVGVDDLSLIPPQMAVHIGGMVHYARVHAEAYRRAPIYSAEDLPKQPMIYRRPQQAPSSPTSSDDTNYMDEQELIPCSSRVLREICRGRTADSLPPELRRFATLEVLDMPNPFSDTQGMATRDPPQPNQTVLHHSQNMQPESQRLPAPLHPTSTRVRVAGTTTAIGEQPHAKHQSTGHTRTASKDKQSITSPRHAGDRIPNGEQATGCDVVNGNNGKDEPLPRGQRRIQPQKILLRGEPSERRVIQPNQERNSRMILLAQENTANKDTAEARTEEQFVVPIGLDTTQTQHVAGPRDPKVIRAKHKGSACIALKGPLSTKFKWTRPNQKKNPQAQLPKKGGELARLKRKNPMPSATGPAKRATGKGKSKEIAQADLNPEGFYEVEVHYEHVAKLAEGCGFTTADIQETIHRDNEERRTHALMQNSEQNMDTAEGPQLDITFDSESGDDLSSEEEA